MPENIIVATFTVKAAKEMKARLAKMLDEDVEKRMVIGTFHSIAVRYLVC
jgi:DNA helicase-2/ATP-dependent DNA helicase PcrA